MCACIYPYNLYIYINIGAMSTFALELGVHTHHVFVVETGGSFTAFPETFPTSGQNLEF